MELILKKVQKQDKQIILNLTNLYLHDVSVLKKEVVINEGFFVYEGVEACWDENSSLEAYLILLKKDIVGFIFLSREVFFGNTFFTNVSDIFVIKRYRRLGIASCAVTELFKNIKDRIQVFVLYNDGITKKFWQQYLSLKGFQVEEKEVMVDRELFIVYKILR